jgi:hypothetical protein
MTKPRGLLRRTVVGAKLVPVCDSLTDAAA